VGEKKKKRRKERKKREKEKGLHNVVENGPNSKAKPKFLKHGRSDDGREILRRVEEIEAVKAAHQLLVHFWSKNGQ